MFFLYMFQFKKKTNLTWQYVQLYYDKPYFSDIKQ
jgi:hypothetical protein